MLIMDVLQILAGCQFAIRHVQEFRVTDQLPQQVPGLTVRRVIGDVATGRGEVQRDTTIVGHRQDIEQLFQVGPMILAVTERNGQATPLASFGLCGSIRIGTVEGHRRRVIVQLVQTDVEFLHHMTYDVQHQCRHVRRKESIQAATDAIVIEVFEFALRQPQQFGDKPLSPFPQSIDRLARNQDISKQQQQATRCRDGHPAAIAWQVLLQEGFQLHPFQQLVHDR